jgi:non-lysosomal glucosylceramidase
MMASHLIQRGLVEEGLTIVQATRARHDGSRRNPWNDIECGSYYVRALSSYALINAYSGLTFDQRDCEIGFRPARGGDGVYFWSAGRGWGVVEMKGSTVTLTVKGGELAVSRLRLPGLSGTVTVQGQVAERNGDVILLGDQHNLQAGDWLVVAGVETYGQA